MHVLIWQLIDSAFPSDGFAHSAGLEASVQHGYVESGDSVHRFAMHALAQCGRTSLPVVTAAHDRPEDLPELDELSDAFFSNPVANRASRAQGRALLISAARSFPHATTASIQSTIDSGGLAGHYAPLFGTIFNALDVNLVDTQRAFLFISARGVSSAAVRLGIIGAYEAQAMQADVCGRIDAIIDECGALAPHEIAQTAPLIDMFQSTHDRLYSRLFQS